MSDRRGGKRGRNEDEVEVVDSVVEPAVEEEVVEETEVEPEPVVDPVVEEEVVEETEVEPEPAVEESQPSPAVSAPVVEEAPIKLGDVRFLGKRPFTVIMIQGDEITLDLRGARRTLPREKVLKLEAK